MTEYESFVKRYGSIHRNKCIDGTITGQSCCIGYCNYCEHPGFLTKSLRKKHDCIHKNCYHYVPKQRTKKEISHNDSFQSLLMQAISKSVESFEGMKVLRLAQMDDNGWTIHYVTISNDYPILDVSKAIETELGCELLWNNLNYDFETAAKLIFA